MEAMNFSYHIFLLPFNWGKKEADNKRYHFSQLVNLDEAHQFVLKDERWKSNLYLKFSEPEDYNEYVYFYPTVRDVLYDNDASDNQSKVIRHYQFKPAEEHSLKYIINIQSNGSIKSYELEIDYILMNLYKTGIGLLSYHLKNIHSDQQDWNDILSINEYGRRIYPPYFNYKSKNDFSTQSAKQTSLAHSIEIKGPHNKGSIDILEDFESQTGLSVNYTTTKPSEIKQIPNHIKQILPDNFVDYLNVRPTLDDRMFVVSSYCDNAKKYTTDFQMLSADTTDEESVNQFYQYIFIDGPGSPGVANKGFQAELLKVHLYKRWIEYGTLYGLSRYSLVSYTTWDKVLVDTRTIYYKIAELCLLQRSSVIKFSEEVRRIAAMNENESRLSAHINDLYKNYIIFINKIYFRDITPQEQGIELYDMLREKMKIEKEVTDLDKEINELHAYAVLQEEKMSNTRLQLLTVLGGLFIVPSFIIGFYGIDTTTRDAKPLLPLLFIMAFVSLFASLQAVQQGNMMPRYRFILGISTKTWIVVLIITVAIFLALWLF